MHIHKVFQFAIFVLFTNIIITYMLLNEIMNLNYCDMQ